MNNDESISTDLQRISVTRASLLDFDPNLMQIEAQRGASAGEFRSEIASKQGANISRNRDNDGEMLEERKLKSENEGLMKLEGTKLRKLNQVCERKKKKRRGRRRKEIA